MAIQLDSSLSDGPMLLMSCSLFHSEEAKTRDKNKGLKKKKTKKTEEKTQEAAA